MKQKTIMLLCEREKEKLQNSNWKIYLNFHSNLPKSTHLTDSETENRKMLAFHFADEKQILHILPKMEM